MSLEEDLNIEVQSAMRDCDLDMLREFLQIGPHPMISWSARTVTQRQ